MLPKSHVPMWAVLGKTKIDVDEDAGVYLAKFPPEVKALDGKKVTIKGFMLPLESSERFNYFLLSKRTPTCYYCPPGEPNEIVDVNVAFPVTPGATAWSPSPAPSTSPANARSPGSSS